MNKAQETPYEQSWAAFQDGLKDNSRGLAMAEGVAMGAAYIMSGGVGVGASADLNTAEQVSGRVFGREEMRHLMQQLLLPKKPEV